jgi:hypothetical protein
MWMKTDEPQRGTKGSLIDDCGLTTKDRMELNCLTEGNKGHKAISRKEAQNAQGGEEADVAGKERAG